MEMYMIMTIHGLVYGMLLFMVASGLTLVFGMMGVLNLAHGTFYMMGAYIGYSLAVATKSFWVALLISPLIVGIIGMIIERLLLRKVYARGHLSELLLTFGLFYVLGQTVQIIWGTTPLRLEAPQILAGNIQLFLGSYPVYRLFILFFSGMILIALSTLLMKTRVGILVRAAVSDPEMVDALGTNSNRLFMGVFSGGAALAGIAGVVAAPFLSVYPNMQLDVLVDCFVVIVIGGFGSILGALIASVFIGELQSFGILWFPRFALVFQFLLMAIVLIIRPTGILGEKE